MPSIWNSLHNLNHVDHNFDHVSNQFMWPDSFSQLSSWDTNTYQQSIEMFFSIPIVIGLIYLLIVLLSAVCYCFCRKQCNQCCPCCAHRIAHRDTDYIPLDGQNPSLNAASANEARVMYVDASPSSGREPMLKSNVGKNGVAARGGGGGGDGDAVPVRGGIRLRPGARYVRLSLALLGIVAIAVSIYYSTVVDDDAQQMQQNYTDSYQPYSDCITFADELQLLIDDSITQCEEILNVASAQPLYGNISLIESVLEAAKADLEDYSDTADAVSWGDTGEVDKYRQTAMYTSIAVGGFAAVILIISLIIGTVTTSERFVCCHTLFNICLSIGLFLIWVVASFQFAFSVEISDVCSDPNNAVMQGVNSTTDPSVDTQAIVRYYVYCDSDHPYNPLIQYTNESLYTMSLINGTVIQLDSVAGTYGIQSEADALESDYNQAMRDLSQLQSSLDCTEINGYYIDTQSKMCDDLIRDWYITYAMQFLFVLLLLIRNWFVCTINESIDHSDEKRSDADRDEVSKHRSMDGPFGMDNADVQMNNSMSQHKTRRKSTINKPKDAAVKKCLKYLLAFEDVKERITEADILKKKGYPRGNRPVDGNVVEKALAILRSKDRNPSSSYSHPLLQEL